MGFAASHHSDPHNSEVALIFSYFASRMMKASHYYQYLKNKIQTRELQFTIFEQFLFDQFFTLMPKYFKK